MAGSTSQQIVSMLNGKRKRSEKHEPEEMEFESPLDEAKRVFPSEAIRLVIEYAMQSSNSANATETSTQLRLVSRLWNQSLLSHRHSSCGVATLGRVLAVHGSNLAQGVARLAEAGTYVKRLSLDLNTDAQVLRRMGTFMLMSACPNLEHLVVSLSSTSALTSASVTQRSSTTATIAHLIELAPMAPPSLRTLSLRVKKMNDLDFISIAHSFSFITSLKLTVSNVTDTAFIEALSHLPDLKSLTISSCPSSLVSSALMMSLATRHSNLESLHLFPKNGIDKAAFVFVHQLEPSCQFFPSLKTLALGAKAARSSLGPNSRSISTLAADTQNSPLNSPMQSHAINVNIPSWTTVLGPFFDAFSKCGSLPKLEALTISGDHILSLETLARVTRTFGRSLACLNLHAVQCRAREFVDCLKECRDIRIVRVDVSGTAATEDAAAVGGRVGDATVWNGWTPGMGVILAKHCRALRVFEVGNGPVESGMDVGEMVMDVYRECRREFCL
ncbi:hypothetical protein CcCBS67573_g00152 [Chytriomyces confervae]|uniref:F-box domain-containing protein n=1 Tax=Chytriomyces confervae TaxID=246404 RepID=A0A507FQ69_9FUNG|nr:hypothetical protein CcCBS67573_g00152 [Chytriomyces confervae]